MPLDRIWWIPLFPLIGAAVAFLCAMLPKKKRWATVVSLVCPIAVLASFLVSAAAVVTLANIPGRVHEVIFGSWLPSVRADWGMLLDPLSSVLILVVTGIGFLIHVYSAGYMRGTPGIERYFGYLNLFVAFMLLLVLANNYALLFIGWEGVGLCSYLLIGFDYTRIAAPRAGMKAFVVNRVGDAGFILGMAALFSTLHTLRYTQVMPLVRTFPVGSGVLIAIALLFFVGATGKSAQVPMHVWLPDAMEGPTPVSALIHAATMVTAGVYLLARSSAIFELAPQAKTVVASIGAFTAIFAATIALVQNDIKRVLAYSTMSQLGYMFLAAGVGAWWVAIFHLLTHAFFKALLFLGAGSVIHGLHGEQNMRKMGALKSKLPVTHWTMFVGAVAISGIPGLAGFFSKDAILEHAFGAGYVMLYIVGLTTAGLTAVYMWRLMHLVFYGDAHSKASHIHEGGLTMRLPLILLAIGSIFSGWLQFPKSWPTPAWTHSFEPWLAPVFAMPDVMERHAPSLEWILTGASLAVALIGISIARYLYHHRRELPSNLEQALKPLHGILVNRWYMDEFYQIVFVNGLAKGGGKMLSRFDRSVLDGGVNRAAKFTRFISRVFIWWDTNVVDGLVRITALALRAFSYPVRLLQTGRVHAYALAIALGVTFLLAFYAR